MGQRRRSSASAGVKHSSQRRQGDRRRGVRFSWLRLGPLEDRRLLNGAGDTQAIQLFDASPALFVKNQGQVTDDAVRYAFYGSGANVLLTDAGPVFQVFRAPAGCQTLRRLPPTGPRSPTSSRCISSAPCPLQP